MDPGNFAPGNQGLRGGFPYPPAHDPSVGGESYLGLYVFDRSPGMVDTEMPATKRASGGAAE